MSELIQILKEAQEHYEFEMLDFKFSQEAENKGDSIIQNLHWASSQYESGKVFGLLKAYEIMTGRKIFGWQIKKEIEYMQDRVFFGDMI